MTRTISTDLRNHIAQGTTTLANFWKITRQDGTVMGFTDHDQNITYDSVEYKASTGFSPTDVALKSDMSVSNLEVEGVLDSSAITEPDLHAGVYDYAGVEVFMLNYKDLTQGTLQLKRGILGEVSRSKGRFVAEVRGMSQHLQTNIGRIYIPQCDAIFADSRCGLDKASFTGSDDVTSVTSNQVFFAVGAVFGDNEAYRNGELTWVTGSNAGLTFEVKEVNATSNEVILSLPAPYAIQIGDVFSITQGCDKLVETCRDRFNNIANFRGFPHLPGLDGLMETSGTLNQ